MKYIDSKDSQGKKIIVSVIGPDRIGIIAAITTILTEKKINVLDISQTIMQQFFSMVLIADMENSTVELGQLKDVLAAKGAELSVRIDAQHEDAFKFMHRI